MWDGLYWCLYGHNFGGLNKDKLPTWEERQTKDFRGTRVVAVVMKGETRYMVARHIKFKGTTKTYKGDDKLMLFKDGEFVSSGSSTQQAIDDMLGMSSRVFMNSVIFGQRMTRLVNADNNEKRELFNEIFNVVFIPKAKEKGKERYNALSTELQGKEFKFNKLGEDVAKLETEITEKEEILTSFESEKKENITSLKSRVGNKEEALEEARKEKSVAEKAIEALGETDSGKLQQSYEKVRDERDVIKQELNKQDSHMNGFEQELTKANSALLQLESDLESMETDCDRCGQKLPAKKINDAKSDLKKEIKAEGEAIKTLKKKKGEQEETDKKLTKDYEKLTPKVDKAKENLDSVNDTLRESYQRNSELKTSVGDIERIKVEIRELDARAKAEKARKLPNLDVDHLKKTKKEKETEHMSLGIEVEDFKKEVGYVRWWVEKGYGNAGMKAYVFNAMLNKLNMYMEKYATRLGGRVYFSIDLEKASMPFTTDVYRGNKVVDYAELSGGAKQRIDICLAFACHDLISQANFVNLLVMDEIMEGLDDEGIEQVFDLIRLKASDGDSIYVISHLSNLNSKSAKTMRVWSDGVHSYVE